MRFALAIGLLAFSSVTSPALATPLGIYYNQADFFSAATVESITTFDNFPATYGFTDLNVAIDQVMYSAESCTNRCWTVDSGFGAPPSNIFVSNNIADNILSFGSKRYSNSLGFLFVGSGNVHPVFGPPSWNITVLEVDGTNTHFNIAGQFNYAPGFSPLYVGLVSAVGIEQVLIEDDPAVPGESNWGFDDVARGAIVSHPGRGGGAGRTLDDCTPVPPPADGGPSGLEIGTSCIRGENAFPFPRQVPEPMSSLLWVTGTLGWLAWRSAHQQR